MPVAMSDSQLMRMSLSTSMLGFDRIASREPREQYSMTMYALPSWIDAPIRRQTFGWRSFASSLISSFTRMVRAPCVALVTDDPPLELEPGRLNQITVP